MNGEFELIAWIRNRVHFTDAVTIGIGDDAAGVSIDRETLIVTDTLLEGTHFDRATATPREIGRKAMAVNLSDLAAMAARPVAAVVALTLTRGAGHEFAQELMDGAITLAESREVAVVGGDVTTWDGPVAITVTAIGEPTGRGAVRRNGARAGDWILVTGELGGSLVSGRHLWFQPRIDEALRLQELVGLHAMIDISDGLAADLGHVLDESEVGAVLREVAIPVSEAARANEDPLRSALGDGEDFELLFTVSASDGERLLADPPFETRLSHIGEISAEQQAVLERHDGQRQPLERLGWRHDV